MNGPEVAALAAQLDELIALVGELSEEDFARPTRCPGWSVAELVAHCEGMLHRLLGENAQPVDGEPRSIESATTATTPMDRGRGRTRTRPSRRSSGTA
jgi:uncharacterized protein (TIGR03083 family)